jgi:hypothetical protein
MMAEDATPLVEALLEIIAAARAHLPPDALDKDEFITRVLEAIDSPRIMPRSPRLDILWREARASSAGERTRDHSLTVPGVIRPHASQAVCQAGLVEIFFPPHALHRSRPWARVWSRGGRPR